MASAIKSIGEPFSKSLGNGFCVTMGATWTDFFTARNGIPGAIGPFNSGFCARHCAIIPLLSIFNSRVKLPALPGYFF